MCDVINSDSVTDGTLVYNQAYMYYRRNHAAPMGPQERGGQTVVGPIHFASGWENLDSPQRNCMFSTYIAYQLSWDVR